LQDTFANLYIDAGKIATVQEVILSSGLLTNVVNATHLAADLEFGARTRSISDKLRNVMPERIATELLGPPSEQPDTPEAREARAVGRLSQVIKTQRVGATYVIEIEVTASTAVRARTLAQTVAEAYLADQIERRTSAATQDMKWLRTQVNELRDELIKSEENVETIRANHGLTQTNGDSTVGRQAITDASTQLSQAEGEVAAAEARYQQALRVQRDGGSLDGLPEVISSKLIETLREQQSALNRTIADLSAHYTSTYPGLARALEDRKALNAQIAAEISRIVEGLHNNAQAAVAHRDALRKQLAVLVGDSSENSNAIALARLREAERVAETNRTVFEASLVRLKELEAQASHIDVEARIISPATEPPASSFPKRITFFGGGAVAGMLVGVGLLVLLALLDKRVTSRSAIESSFGLPVLATIPRLRRRDVGGRVKLVSIAGSLVRNPLSPFAESLRSLRSRLFLGRIGSPVVIQVTSALPGEGKSTLASGFAISLASTGLRTALVDLDLYNPSITRAFGLSQDRGVTNLLAGAAIDGNALVGHQTLPLKIISAGSSDHRGLDLIGSRRFTALVSELRQYFDVIILDTPPILAVSNPIMTSVVADATILTVAWRQSCSRDVGQAVRALRQVGAPIAGIALNKADLARVGQFDKCRYAYDSYISRYMKSLPRRHGRLTREQTIVDDFVRSGTAPTDGAASEPTTPCTVERRSESEVSQVQIAVSN